MDLGDALYRAFTGGEPPSDLREVVRALGGARPAAGILGVHPRTVRRYVTTTGTQRRTPSASRANALRDAAQRDPGVRAAALGGRRAARIRDQGTLISADADNSGPIIAGTDGRRRRRIRNWHITGDSMAPAIDAWLAGDDAGAAQAFTDAMHNDYVAGWQWGDVDMLAFHPNPR